QAGQHGGGQFGQVLAAFAQWRHLQFDHVDAVVQVVAEAPVLDQLGQVLVGGREDADIHRLLVGRAHRAHRLFLDRAQQLHLHLQRQFSHFVQEQGAAVRSLEQAGLVGVRAAETALAMAEEFALHQLAGNGTAVDRHERAGRARALGMDGACNQLLADARLAEDVDRRLAARDLADGGAQHIHGLRVAQQAPALFGVGARCRALGVVEFQRVLDQSAQHRDVHRLADEIERTGLQCLHSEIHAAECGDHRHRRARVVLGDLADQLDAVAIGQAHVGDAQVVRIAGQQLTCLGQVGGGTDAQPHAAEGQHQQFADVAFVVDDEGAAGFIHGRER
ncbi:hypothetical protein SM139_4196, partial [Stenotrophomonas maltophilia]